MSTEIIALIIIFVVGGLFVLWLRSRNKGKVEFEHEAYKALNYLGIPNTQTNLKHSYKTPGGARVRSTVPVPPDFLTLIDEGLQRRIDRFAVMFPLWTGHRLISDHDIWIINPSTDPNTGKVCRNEVTDPGSPCIYVGGWQSAGTVLGAGNDKYEEINAHPIIIAPHQEAQNWAHRDYFRDTIHNESEHVAGWVNKRIEPTGVFYHFLGANDAHPWYWGEAKGLAQRTTKHNCLPPQ